MGVGGTRGGHVNQSGRAMEALPGRKERVWVIKMLPPKKKIAKFMARKVRSGNRKGVLA